MSEEPYSNVRDFLGHLIGKRIVDITQHDKDEFEENGKSYVMLLIEEGNYIKFFVDDDGFSYTEDES